MARFPSLSWLAFVVALPAQDDRPVSIPVQATASIDAKALPTTGRAELQLRFVCEETLDRAFAVRVELRKGNRVMLRRDHAPPLPTAKWPKQKPVEYALPLLLQQPPDGVRTGDSLDVWLGFVDTTAGPDRIVPPLARDAGRDGLVKLAQFAWPELGGAPDAAAVTATVTAALALAKTDPRAAWDQLEFAFRRLDDYPRKQELQKALWQVGKMPPAPLSFEEQDIVAGRIAEERARWLREVAGRMYDQGKLLGALLLLDAVGGSLQEQADRAVLGALDSAKRVTQDRDGIAAKVFALSKAQQDEVTALTEKLPKGEERLAAGLKLVKDKVQRPIGRELIRTLEFTPELREKAQTVRAQIEKEWLADVPPAERAEADAALQHPCWARTSHRASHRFALIGPQALLAGIPDDSLLRFDLAYLYLTDLFGRVPNPAGDRVTVYWKELWDFGGGVGGGKIIDIGNADPNGKAMRIDNGLLYHELTHCIDDTNPVYGGMHEGLADFGAAFAQMELGQVAGGRASIGLALRAFLGDYLERDLEYWRIPNYGPSAGFFLHFVTTYGKSGEGYAWQRYRKFFRDYRACRVKDGRTPTLARAFAFHLVEAFGEAAFADLVKFRWPLLPGDLEAVRREQLAAQKRQFEPQFDYQPGSPVPRDRTAKNLAAEGSNLEAHHDKLGIVTDWHVIGPFRKEGYASDQFRFPPELEIDLAARYESINNNPTWRRPGSKPVTVDRTGWLHFDFAYMDWSAIYALTHVTAEHDTEAWFHLRADDEVALFVDDEQVDQHGGGAGGLGPWRPNWNVLLPDAIRFAVPLKKGRHKVLVKVHNHTGPSGFILAIAQRNGTPLPGWTTDVDPPQKKLAAIDVPDGRKWPQRYKARFDQSAALKKLDETVGKWRVRNGALEGFATAREVEWRKYTVRPGFPKDSPSNLAWLPEKATEHADAFALTIELPAGDPAPKLCVVIQGEGNRDALSGWSLLLDPDGDGVRGYLERYDLRYYASDRVAYDKASKKPVALELVWFGKRLTVKLGGQVLFDQVPLRAVPGKYRIGIATWGEAMRVEEIELRGPVRTR